MGARGLRSAAAPAALALLAVAASGHASSADPRLPAIALDWVHLLAAAVWVGGIALVVVVAALARVDDGFERLSGHQIRLA